MERKEAIEIVRKLYNESLFLKKDKEAMVTLIPELKESEGEKIRKALINTLQEKIGLGVVSNGYSREDYIAWLEKQGEQKPNKLFDIPENGIENDVSVTSRMEHIPEHLKSIAKFILEYAHWNLHKDEWNHPVPEVPLFRVLDALVQEGKPYQGACSCVGQKPAWSEEDEEMFKTIANSLDRGLVERVWHTTIEKVLDWLKSLKDRVQPKQEWSEKDEKIKEGLINSLAIISANTRTDSSSINYTFSREIDWLKSLRPQFKWKPTEEQVEALGYAIKLCDGEGEKGRYYLQFLYKLMNDFKAL